MKHCTFLEYLELDLDVPTFHILRPATNGPVVGGSVDHPGGVRDGRV